MASSEKFHFEKNTIVTSTTNINKSDVEKYIVENLDNFREGSHFIVMCGFHGSPEGKLLQYDSDFMSQYQSMFTSINKGSSMAKCIFSGVCRHPSAFSK